MPYTETPLRLSYYLDDIVGIPFFDGEITDGIVDFLTTTKSLMAKFLAGRSVVHGAVEGGMIEGPCYIGAGTVIHEGAVINGPVFIGEECSIRHGAQIRSGAVISDGCVVGHSAEVKASFLGVGAKVQSGVFIGDSILGTGARVGSGCILSNRRFGQDRIVLGAGENKLETDVDFFGAVLGDYARLGANVVTAPGTLVGPFTWVASLVSARGFIPRGKLVLLRQDLDIRDIEEKPLRSGEGEYEHR